MLAGHMTSLYMGLSSFRVFGQIFNTQKVSEILCEILNELNSWKAEDDPEYIVHPRSQGFRVRMRGEMRKRWLDLGRSILRSDWLTPYCLKITELDS